MIETASPTFDQIRAQVAAIRRKVADAPFYGIRTNGRWLGERRWQTSGETYYIDQCDSPLQMRIAMQDAPADADVRVLVTPLADQEVGPDVLVRLANRTIYPINNWRILKTLFDAQHIDSRVIEHSWIAEALVQLAGEHPFPSVPGGLLDADTVWHILLDRKLGLREKRPDLIAVLKWSLDQANVGRLREASNTFHNAAAKWLRGIAGPAAATVLDVVRHNEQPDAVSLGLVLGVLNDPRADSVETARVRLEERYTGQSEISSPIAARWHEAATSIVSLQLVEDERARQRLAERADDILTEIGAIDSAWVSKTSPRGYQQRLEQFGACLSKAADDVSIPEELVAAKRSVLEHNQRRFDSRRRDRVEMSMRLIRWLAEGQTSAKPASLREAISSYVRDGGFIDWARNVLVVDEPVAGLARGFTDVCNRVAAIRKTQNRQFAELLKDWTSADSDLEHVVPVERVLRDVIAPIGKSSPVLVVMMDGMSVGVCRELMEDIGRQEWTEVRPVGQPEMRPALATIPSVTEVSRTSLLCGERRQGTQSDEKRSFPKIPELLSCCKANFPPVLFHKGDLHEDGDAGLASTVREAIEDTRTQVVGVVVNAVDDHLTKGEQLDTRWTRESIKVLPTLLYAAHSTGRVVVLVSDHGHVLDHETASHSAAGAHERWRPDDGSPIEGEITVAGPRVVIPTEKKLIVPWIENLRYKGKKNGYHGGVTLQEMVIPIVVLTPMLQTIEGWEEAVSDLPNWWEQSSVVGDSATVPAPRVRVQQPPRKKKPGVLFDPDVELPETPAGADWIEVLVTSEAFQDQKRIAGRAVPRDETIRQFLACVDQRGGKMTSQALLRAMNVPAIRLRSIVAAMQRVLNVDGYQVLSRDEASDTIELNRGLLCRQFDLEEVNDA